MAGKSELKLFDDNPPQIAVTSGIFVDVHTKSVLDDDSSPIIFEINGSDSLYMDLNDTFLSLKVRVLGKDGKTLTDSDVKPFPSNWFMNALFEDVILTMNDIQVEGGNRGYPYKATIEAAFNYGDDAKRIQLLSSGFSQSDDERQKWIGNSQNFELVGALHLDLFDQIKYLPPKINIRITLRRAKNSFCLYGKPSKGTVYVGDEWQVKITSAILYMRRASVHPAILSGHKKGMGELVQSKSTPKTILKSLFPYTKGVVTSFALSKGTTGVQKTDFLTGRILPKFLIIGMVKASAFNGNLKDAPFHFEHFNVCRMELLNEGIAVPFTRPYQMDFERGIYTEAYYRSLLVNTNIAGKDVNNGMDLLDFKENGYCFFTFNLAPDFDIRSRQVISIANLRLDITFKKPLEEPINIVALAEYDALLQIGKDGSIEKDAYI